MSKDPRYPDVVVPPEFAKAVKGTAEKDDCFDMPEPGTPYHARIKAEAEEYAAKLEALLPDRK